MAAMSEAMLGRLEAAVSRLEALENRIVNTSGSGASSGGRADKVTVTATPPSRAEAGGSSVEAYDNLLTTKVAAFYSAGKALGGGVEEISAILKRAFEAERNVVAAIAQCKKPGDAEFQKLLEPVAKEIEAAHAKAHGRRSAEDNHYKVVSEALGALSWVCYQPGAGMNPPPQHVEESLQGADFYANKILMEHRQTGPNHVAWLNACKECFYGLKAYAKSFHSTGPAWNPSGIQLSAFKGGSGPVSTAQKKGGPPPAAPPPPPPGFFDDKPSSAASSQQPDGMAAIFAQLSTKGESVTSGLRRVTDDMKAKNRSDRSGLVSAPSKAPAASAPTAAAPAPKTSAPPVLELQNQRKWAVENHRGNRSIVIEDVEAKHSVYIYNCENCTIQVKGKVNAISIDKCKKTGVLFEDVVASCELVNSQSMQIQVTGHCATFAVDKCDGLQLVLSHASLGAEIISAKSTELNVTIPGKTEEDEMAEHSIPEQFVSRLEGGKFVTTPVSHSAG